MSSDGPFEWLAGGLFFGGKHSKQRSIESIDSCKDASVLLKGISESFDEIKAAPTPSSDDTAATATAGESSNKETPEVLLAARLRRLRFLLYDERAKETGRRGGNAPTVVGTTLQGLTQGQLEGMLPNLLAKLILVPFEGRKDVTAIFNYLLVCGFDGADAAVYRPLMNLFRDYVDKHYTEILRTIVPGLEPSTHQGQSDLCLHYGSMYRASLRHPLLYQQVVGTHESAVKYVFPFLDTLVHAPNFEVASDAMETLREILTAGSSSPAVTHVSRDPQLQQELAQMAATFWMREYDDLWNQRFRPKLLSESAPYMTRRVALQILSTVLLTRSNYNLMIQFVASKSNLILAMKLLRVTSPHITLDAFHVFKVFVANPNKPPEVVNILRDNKGKLCKYLASLHQEKEASDKQFKDEKALIIATIEAL